MEDPDPDAAAEPTTSTCPFIFKKRSIKNKGARKRKNSTSEDDLSSDENDRRESIVVKPTHRRSKANPNVQHTSARLEKRARAADSSSEEDEKDEAVLLSYKSNRSAMANGPLDQGATATLEIETERDRDAQAIFEKRLEINKDQEGKEDDKVYRGINNYTQFFKPKDTAAGNASSGLVRKGPIRAPANLRATVRWDYQPDICKDYKETGFCGFGDSCKFLHDRSDYKHGWQLEREWAEGVYGEDDDEGKYEIHSDEEDLPFKCTLCRESFTDPIVTKCVHYFCEKCALERFKKTQRCFVCNAQTSGVFNPARKIIARLNREEKSKKTEDNTDSDSN